MKTVFHLPEGHPEYGDRALGNVENLLGDDTVAVEVAVVANGSGVRHLLADAPVADRVRALLAEDVAVHACRNTLENTERSAGDLVDGVEIVPSAMGELTRRQDAGYAYVRP